MGQKMRHSLGVLTLAGIATATAVAAMGWSGGDPAAAPPVVRLDPVPFEHRLDGAWRRDGHGIDAPLETVTIPAPVEIMDRPVSVAQYMACVAAGACEAPEGPTDRPELPVVGVSYLDATAYADWLSDLTGQDWRLPTDTEWAQAAGSLWRDDAVGVADDPDNPAVRWIAEYEQDAARARDRDREVRPVGMLNVNELGVHDIGGAVWEWTQTCFRRVDTDATGAITATDEICGIYIAEGLHRAALTLFVRDPKTGGCSVGSPPDNMGFRLVREVRQGPLARIGHWLGL